MPEMRQNPVTGEWVIIATERAHRPNISGFTRNEDISNNHDENCFFCWGNEHTTPPEVYSYRLDNSLPDTPGWLVRVVSNKFAALNLNDDFNIKQLCALENYSYAKGAAEVVIETNNHSKHISNQSIQEIGQVLKAYINRYIALSVDQQIQYVLIFRNHGATAGASLEHPHSQIISTPVIPPVVLKEIDGSKSYFTNHRSCVFCDIVDQEIIDKSRIVYENDFFISFEPYASRTPFETVLMPKYHASRFEKLNDKQINSLAQAWKATFYKLDAVLDNPPYNCFIHTSPTQQFVDDFYHWHLEIIPKLTISAGFELGTGMFINVTIPEDCAELLRNIDVLF